METTNLAPLYAWGPGGMVVTKELAAENENETSRFKSMFPY